MPCTSSLGGICRTFKAYIGSGNEHYHGELCTGCPRWLDTPADAAFKERARETTERAGASQRQISRRQYGGSYGEH